MCEIEMGNVIAGTVIVRVQTEAGDGLRDHAFERECVIVRPGKEILFRMWIGDQLCAVRGQLWSKIGALPTTEPQLVGLNLGIGTANHFKFQIGGDVDKGNGGFFAEVNCAIAPTSFFTAKQSKQDGAPRLRS